MRCRAICQPLVQSLSHLVSYLAARPRHTTFLLFAVMIGVVTAGMLGLPDIRGVLADTKWPLAAGGVLVTVVAYAAIGHRFTVLGRLAGIESPGIVTGPVGFVSTTLGRVVAGGGLAGNLLSVGVLRRHGVPPGETLAVSLLHTYLNYVLVVAVFLAGLGLVMATSRVVGGYATGFMAGGSLVMLLVASISVILFIRPARQKAFAVTASLIQRITGTDLGEHGVRFNIATNRAVSFRRLNRSSVALVALLIVVEALAALTVLWLSSAALDSAVSPVVLVAGFGIGTAAAVASMLPGGLGVQEGTMTGVFTLLGVDVDHAVAIAVLFRVLYFFVPFAVSLVLYKWLLSRRDAREAASALVASREAEPFAG